MNKQQVIKKLEDVQKGCKERLCYYDDVKMAIEKAENRLKLMGIPKDSWVNCVVKMLPGKVCNSYHYSPFGTFITIIRLKTAWKVYSIVRAQSGRCSGGSYRETQLMLSDEAVSAFKKTIHL
jgi:hypothetical protein